MKLLAAAAFAALTTPLVSAQTACHAARESALIGTVRDSTQALVPGASLTLDGGITVRSGSDGRFRFPCVAAGAHHLAAAAEGFAADDLSINTPHTADVRIILQPEEVHIDVDVNAEDQAVEDPNKSGPSNTIAGKQLQSLADDPDDLLRELQQLGAASGGSPANTTISVDGFQGSSKLPPKSSIAYIKVNPDLFSAEYREPPFDGGRVEVYTKPGQSTFHGALFATNGSPWENARDPFSPSKASLGKQRYGFELTGPVRKHGSDFSLDLEHRIIDNFAVVNAVVPDANGNPVSTVANVPTPQRLWIGQARLDWQLGPKNTFITTYSANVNNLQNLNVGGTNLAETGYNSGRFEHILRFTNVTTASAHLMHEARVSFRWDGENDIAASTAPQIQVAGAFTRGGAAIGNQRLHEFNIEADDDAILTTRNHTLKFGTQFMSFNEHQQLTTNFNGTYIFGGSATMTGLQQYQAGTPTAYTVVTGTPRVDFNLVEDAVFVQDDWNAGHGLHIASGLRYYAQNDPTLLNTITPRVGVLWSPTKKGTWTLHAHAGLFGGFWGEANEAEILREDGTDRVTSTVYNPSYQNPFASAAVIHTVRQYNPHISNLLFAIENIGGTRSLPHGWNLSADYYFGRIWNYVRSENVNAPLNGQPTGPRLLGIPNTDILQEQNSGQGVANVEFVQIEQHSLKHVQLFLGAVRVNLLDDTDDQYTSTPQSTFTDAGEFAHRTNQPVWNIFGNATFNLPRKVVLSGNLNGGGDAHYNITTGYDNNGDGDFNDRPQYALPGTPVCAPNTASTSGCAEATPFGLLVAQGGTGVFPRNKGVLPWRVYLDTNIQRAFTLTRNPKADHQQTLTVNVRSSNVLNHTNVTSVGGVLGSPLFTVPYAADPGRRVEAGVRYSF